MDPLYFAQDYDRLVAALKAQHPVDEAMSKAVGGAYEEFGRIECRILEEMGLQDGMSVLDFGCGSGRLSTALGRKWRISYTGVDVVEDLLRYAASKAPAGFRFILNRTLSIPVPDTSADLCCAFSVFTHLLHEDSYIYLSELVRACRPGGRILFSFLEFREPAHWTVFESTAVARLHGTRPHLNVFIERSALSLWAARLGCPEITFIDAGDARWDGHALGQSLAVMTKPA